MSPTLTPRQHIEQQGAQLVEKFNSRVSWRRSILYTNQVTRATKDDFPQVTIKDVLALPFSEFERAA